MASALMGCGSVRLPRSNDGLIFISLPPLRPYAWLAIATRCAALAVAITLRGVWAGRGVKE